MVMAMIKTEGAVPPNNGGHALDSVPNIQSISIITMSP